MSLCATPRWHLFLEDGSLNPCFVAGPVQLLPSGLIFLLGPFAIYRLWNKSTGRIALPGADGQSNDFEAPVRVPVDFLFKSGLISFHIAVQIAVVIVSRGQDGDPVIAETSIASCLANMVALAIHSLEVGRSMVPSGVLLFYWLLSASCRGLEMVSGIDRSLIVLQVMLVTSSVAILCVEYAVPKLNRRSKDDDDEPLLENVDVFSLISLSWMNPFIKKATNSRISPEMLPEIDKDYSTASFSAKFSRNWTSRKSDSIGALIKALAKSFSGHIAISVLFECVHDGMGYTQPFLLSALLKYSQDSYSGHGKPISQGLYIALALFVTSMIQTICGTFVAMMWMRAGAGIKSSLTNAIYKKSLLLSRNEREKHSTGEIVSIMSVDVSTIANMVYGITSIWQAPLQFAVSLFSLSLFLGASVWSLLGIMAIIIPLNSFVSRKLKQLRKKQMRYKDARTRLTTEIITNVKSLKLYGWENALMDRLDKVRNGQQLENLKVLVHVGNVITFIWAQVPFVFACVTFGLYARVNDIPLTAEIVFPAMTLFRMMISPISDIPRLITMFIDSQVSLGRIRDFLTGEELQNCVERLPPARQHGEEAVTLKDVTLLWDPLDKSSICLADINYTARKGELSCIVGRVGAGKSSFLRGILGIMYKDRGTITTKGSVAYVPQEPWLMNATVKENILFGHKFEPDVYQKTIYACALDSDLKILPDGDNTEIGERGVSLSGGQKARLSLARAVYARADVYLLDDPLSAVDQHVGRHIIRHILGPDGLLATKTRILATNAVSILNQANEVVLLENNRIVESGTYQQGRIREMLQEFEREQGMSEETSESIEELSEDTDIGELSNDSSTSGSETANEEPLLVRRNSVKSLRRASAASLRHRSLRSTAPQRTAKTTETAAVGRVKWHVYKRYVAACGYWSVFTALLVIGLGALFSLAGNLWLKAWVESNEREHRNKDMLFWLGGYFVIGLITTLLAVLRRIVSRLVCGLNASKKLHDSMAYRVLHAPMSFFETTPVGRIINRFSSDINELDERLPPAFIDVTRTLVVLAISLGVLIFSAPIVIVVLVPLSFLYHYYQKFYQTTSRETKRLLSMSLSPVYAHFQESLHGVNTIRAFNVEDRFQYTNEQTMDIHLRALFLLYGTNKWLSFRLQSIGSLIMLCAASTAVVGSFQQAFSPGLVGIMMMYTMDITSCLLSIVRSVVRLETSVVAAERVLEYCDMASEKAYIIESNRPPAYWPHDGSIEFKDYWTRYRDNLDPVLRGINLKIRPKEKVGVVGRTGAGKSSIVMGLFRIIEPTGGSIEVDNLNIESLGILDLRSNLSIIPQDSQIFVGTVRQNIDPFDRYSDEQVWQVLEHSHLKSFVESIGGLGAQVSEGGSNMSAGQRQLMCLGRALLNTSNILVLDEATASVDMETDRLVQETIRREFRDRTIVTIAHRLNTIMDNDRIVVVDGGQIIDSGTPQQLLEQKGAFYALANI